MDIEFDSYRKMQRTGMNEMDFIPQSYYIQQHQSQNRYEQQPYNITPKNFHNNGPVKRDVNQNNIDNNLSFNTYNIPQNSFLQQPLTLQPSYPMNGVYSPSQQQQQQQQPPLLSNHPRSQQQSQRQIVVVSPSRRNITTSPLIYSDYESVDGYDSYYNNNNNNNNNTLSPKRQMQTPPQQQQQQKFVSPPTSPTKQNLSSPSPSSHINHQNQQQQQDRHRMSKFLDMLTLNLSDSELRSKMRTAGFEPSEIDHILLSQGRLTPENNQQRYSNNNNNNNNNTAKPSSSNTKRQISLSATPSSTTSIPSKQSQKQQSSAISNKSSSTKSNGNTANTSHNTRYKTGDFNTKKFEKFTLMVGMHFHEKTIRLQMMNSGLTKADCDSFFQDIHNSMMQKQQLKSSKSKKASTMDLSVGGSSNNNNTNSNNGDTISVLNGGNGSGRRRGLSVSSSGSSLDSFFSSTGKQSSAWNRIKNMFFTGRYSDETTREGSVSGDSVNGVTYSEYGGGGSHRHQNHTNMNNSNNNNSPRDSSISYYKSYGNVSGKTNNNATNSNTNNNGNNNMINNHGNNNNNGSIQRTPNNPRVSQHSSASVSMNMTHPGSTGSTTNNNINNSSGGNKLKPYEEIDKEWIAILDTASNSYYYWSKRSGMTTWEHPHSLAVQQSESLSAQHHHQANNMNPLLQSPRSAMTRSVSGSVAFRESLGSQQAMNDYYRNVNTNQILLSPRSSNANNNTHITNNHTNGGNNNANATKPSTTNMNRQQPSNSISSHHLNQQQQQQQQQQHSMRTGTAASITDTLPIHFPIDDEWLQILDPNRNKFYYWNTVTGVTTWTHPLTGSGASGTSGGGKSSMNSNNNNGDINHPNGKDSFSNSNNNSNNSNRSTELFSTGGSTISRNRPPPPVAPRPPPPRTSTNLPASHTAPPSTPPPTPPALVFKPPAFHEKEEYTKYLKMYQMKIPEGGIRVKMKVEGVSDENIQQFFTSVGS